MPRENHHHHHHGHAHEHGDFGRVFVVGIVLNLTFVVIEFSFGLWARSLALLADAGHNLSDVLALLLAWGATVLARRLPTKRHTYGLRRSSVLVALFNALSLFVVIGGIAWEAIRRFGQVVAVADEVVIAVAAVGVLINGITAWMFLAGQKHDLIVRGAYLHMATDAAVSLGVVLAGVIMRLTSWYWIDSVVSLLIVTIIMAGSTGLLRDSLSLALDAVPKNIDPESVERYLASLPGVIAVHDLHIWGMSTSEAALTVHLVKPDANIDDALLERIHHELKEQFSIGHSTVQFECGDADHPCPQAPATVV